MNELQRLLGLVLKLQLLSVIAAGRKKEFSGALISQPNQRTLIFLKTDYFLNTSTFLPWEHLISHSTCLLVLSVLLGVSFHFLYVSFTLHFMDTLIRKTLESRCWLVIFCVRIFQGRPSCFMLQTRTRLHRLSERVYYSYMWMYASLFMTDA